MTKVQGEDGRTVSAMVIPFDDEMAPTGVSKMFNYARALNTVSCAMTTVASILETQRRNSASCERGHPQVFKTPVRDRPPSAFATPSPIIMRNIFT